jgi:outer membrane protein assembly factor BamB
MNVPKSILAICLTALSLNAADSNWPQYRGPQASGLGSGVSTVTQWNVESGENLLWRTPIAGLAHASPVIWGDRVYTITAVKPGGKSELKVGLYGDIDSAKETESHQWRLIALDKATGKVMWDTLAHEGVPRVQRHTKASQCNSTPATDGKYIVAMLASEGLYCFDMEGKVVWKKDFGKLESGFFKVPSSAWGFASSPVISEGRVILQCDVQKDSFLAAFDLATGKEFWKVPRMDVPTWSTPAVIESGGRKQIVVNGWRHTGGYDFRTGEELWKLDGGGDIPTPTPISANGLVYLTSAHGNFRPMRAIRLDAKGDITPDNPGVTNAAIVWAHPRQGNYMQTPILVGDYLYGCSDNAVITCFNAKTGEIQYSQRLVQGGEGFTASPVSDGKNLYFTSELGNIMVVPANGKFSILQKNSMGETCMATPAISNGVLFFRTREHLVAVGKKP